MNTTPAQKTHMKKPIGPRVLLGIVIIVLIAILGYIVSLLFPQTTTEEKSYQKFTLINVNTNYLNNQNFKLVSATKIEKNNANHYFYTPNKNNFKTALKEASVKQGFTNELTEISKGIYIWSKSSTDFKQNYIRLNDLYYLLQFNTVDGLNGTQQVSEAESYNFIRQYFGLNLIDTTLATTQTDKDIKTLYFKASFEGKPVYYGAGEDIIATIVMKQNKIVGATIQLIPGILTKGAELKPLEQISSSNLTDADYVVRVEPGTPNSQSSLGTESYAPREVKFATKTNTFAYYFYIDRLRNNVFLIPSIELTGNYIDEKNTTGKAFVVVVNQDKTELQQY